VEAEPLLPTEGRKDREADESMCECLASLLTVAMHPHFPSPIHHIDRVIVCCL